MRPARVRVYGRFTGGGPSEATVTLDRAAGLFEVRLLRKRKVYRLPTSAVAEIVVWRVITAEMAEKRREKKAKRRSR